MGKLKNPQMRPKVKIDKSLQEKSSSFNWANIGTSTKKFLMRTGGLLALVAMAIDDVRLRADDEVYMLVVGIGLVFAVLVLIVEGSKK